MLLVKHCPACGSKNVRKSRSKGVMGSTFFFTRYRCRDCRMRFRTMRWTAGATALAAATIFGASVFAIKSFVANEGVFSRRPAQGQQWDVAGEPTADMKRRARLGEPDAQLQLGLWHRQANRSVDDKQAVEWFRKAAEKGQQEANYNLALHFAEGRGVLQDYNEAARIVTDLVVKGHAEAQAQLGHMYRRGLGVELSKSNAYLWYNIAASNGSREASALRDTMGTQLSTTELSEVQRQSRVLEQALRAGRDIGPFKPVLQGAPAAAAPAAAPSAASAAPALNPLPAPTK
jgi:TPR repeat protein